MQSHLLLALKNMAGKEKRRSKKRCVGKEGVTMKRLREDVNENLSKVWQEIAAVRDRLDTIHLSYSPSTCCEDPSDYGQRLRAALPPPDISIVPIPLSSQRADSILPSFETCLSRRVGNRIREADFIKWMEFTRRDQCKFTVYFSGNVSRPGRKTKNLDFSIVRVGKSAIDICTAALIALLSHNGKYNGDKELGEAIMRAGILLTSWRPKVIVGLTNGIDVEWFSLKMEEGPPSLQVSPVYPFRESLCALLVADPSALHLSFMDVPGLDVGPQLGEGRTSWVFSANHFGQNVAAKVYKKDYDFVLEKEAKILQCLKDVTGIPRIVKKDTHRKYLLMAPVGKSLASAHHLDDWQDVIIRLVDTLQLVHRKGIVHRDIRSANILLVEEDSGKQALLIDWGFACAVGQEETFAGSVETGSNRLLRQLWKYSRQKFHCSEIPSVAGPSRPSKQNRFGDVKDQSERPLTGGDGASKSGGVQTRSKARLSDMEISCCLGPEDDLVSLVKTFLLVSNNKVRAQLRLIASNDYQSYLEAWDTIMKARPLWKKAQDDAEQCDYKKLCLVAAQMAMEVEKGSTNSRKGALAAAARPTTAARNLAQGSCERADRR